MLTTYDATRVPFTSDVRHQNTVDKKDTIDCIHCSVFSYHDTQFRSPAEFSPLCRLSQQIGDFIVAHNDTVGQLILASLLGR